MSERKYTLTISILASNRKDTLPRTLKSIKPILDNVSSELIIVDTGCDEELLAVIRQYTDRIIRFQWCKDFSRARNAGLKEAQGEWFMFIDDDEWFEDVTEFISFFNSEEKAQYGFGKYIVRNYCNMEGTEWTDSVAGRMFKILDGTKFVDLVHERPVNISGPTRNFSAYAHHYGYVYKTEEEKRAHLERNLSMIQNQVKKEPYFARHYAHLVQEYCIAKEYERIVELSEEGIGNADMNYGENWKDISALYAMIVWALVNLHRHEEAYRRGMEYIASERCSDLGRFAIYEFIAVAAQLNGQYDRALECVGKYFELKEHFNKNPELKYQQSAILIMEADSEENILKTAIVGFAAAAFAGDERMLERYMEYIDFSRQLAIPEAEQCMCSVVAIMRRTTRIVACSAIAERIMKNGSLGNLLLLGIMKLKETDLQGFYKVADIMAMTELHNGYVQYLRIVSARDDIYADRLTGLYEKAVESITDIVNLDSDFWSIAIEKNIPIGAMIERSPISRWIRGVDSFLAGVRVKELIERRQQLDRLMDSKCIHMRYFDMGMAEALLIRKRLMGATLDSLKAELNDFADVVMEFYKRVYKENVFAEYPSVLPARCQGAIILKRMCKGEITDMALIRQQLSRLMPGLKNIMDRYEELV